METKQRIPAMMTAHALKSLRDSGYSLPAAIGEVIDNSIEAGSNLIRVVLMESGNERGKKHVHQIIVVDDGEGMSKEVLWHYPQLGFSTRYMSTTTIGKYGVGAKLAALNFARRLDVWTRTSPDEPWLHVYLDQDEAMADEEAGREVGIVEPDETQVPHELRDLLPSGSGTVVLWSKGDRLEEGRWASDVNALRVEVEKELSRMFRRFIQGGITIEVNSRPLQPHDPLFLMEETWADTRLAQYYRTKDGQELAQELGFSWPKNKRGDVELPSHFAAEKIAEEDLRVPGTKSTIKVVVTLYPREVIRKRFMGGDSLAKDLRVDENQGAISFVRLDREINYTNVPRIFPRGVEEADRFIGVEVNFSPELDGFFGVRNVKRGVEPHNELREAIRAFLKKYLETARERLLDLWGEMDRSSKEAQKDFSDTAKKAAEVNRVLPKGRVQTPKAEDEAAREEELSKLAEDLGKADEQSKKEYVDRVRSMPFVIESVDWPGTMFIDIQHYSHQVIIRLNSRHPFYREMWEPIRLLADAPPGSISGAEANDLARRTIEALTLLLIAYGKAESMHSDPHEQYGELRDYWGKFLSSLLTKVKGTV